MLRVDPDPHLLEGLIVERGIAAGHPRDDQLGDSVTKGERIKQTVDAARRRWQLRREDRLVVGVLRLHGTCGARRQEGGQDKNPSRGTRMIHWMLGWFGLWCAGLGCAGPGSGSAPMTAVRPGIDVLLSDSIH